jgi:hypothetical protein
LSLPSVRAFPLPSVLRVRVLASVLRALALVLQVLLSVLRALPFVLQALKLPSVLRALELLSVWASRLALERAQREKLLFHPIAVQA